MEYDALEKRLKEVREDDHERGCEGRFYSCSCDYENLIDQALKDSQVAIADLRARNDALCDIIFRYVDPCDVLPEDDAIVAEAVLAANRDE